MKCPKCIGKLSPVEIILKGVYLNGKLKGQAVSDSLSIDQCFLCSGLWFDKGELEKYMAERITIVGNSTESDSPTRELDDKLGQCPRCSLPMTRISAPKDRTVTMDQCNTCEGIWLDDVEIDKLERANIPILERLLSQLSKRFSSRRSKSGE